jgi:ubiquinol-cytochrome c reductase iron-sulfur subunit
MSRARDVVVAAFVLLLGRRHPPSERGDAERIVPEQPKHRNAEALARYLLMLASASATAFVVVYAVDPLNHKTQWLGLCLGIALLAFAAALTVTALELVPTEELAEEYPPIENTEEQLVIEQLVEESADGLTRRRLFALGLLSAGGALGLAALTPALGFGPLLRIAEFFSTPWRRGRLLVDENGRPWKASDIEPLDLYKAFAEGADKEELGAGVVLVRLAPGALRLPPELHGYDADGIVAYSDICTHAGCAISLYRAPLFAPAEPKPALVCPCHYSTFDPADGGNVLFGPAGRRLPMLPLEIDRAGRLRAKGNFSGAVGPSWWGVRNRRPTS